MKPADDIAVAADDDAVNANGRMVICELRTLFGEMVVAFDQLSDKIAECVAINRYLA